MTNAKTFQILISTIIICALTIQSCNTQYLKEGETLYTGAQIIIKNDTLSKTQKNKLKEQIKQYIAPKTNTSFLGIKPKLWIYNITPEPTKNKGTLYWLKYKIGEKPVLLSQVDKQLNQNIIQNHAQNKGYFNAHTSTKELKKGKKAQVQYTITTGTQYQISNIIFPQDTTLIAQKIKETKPKSLLKKGQPFDLDIIKAERTRIDNQMKDQGFYYFHSDNIIVQADTISTNKNQVELNLKLKENTPDIAKQQFKINQIIVFPDYNITNAKEYNQNTKEYDPNTKEYDPNTKEYNQNTPLTQNQEQPYQYKQLLIFDKNKKFKPFIFEKTFQIQKNDIYNRTKHNLTLNRLTNLGTFKFVKNQFIKNDSTSNSFDAYYFLTPKEIKSLNVEWLGKTNSANYTGSEINLHWTHRNTFKGAEQLKINAFGGVDAQLGANNTQHTRREGNIYRIGAQAELSIPRIIAPFPFHSSSAFIPRTNASLSYEFVTRTQWYRLHNFNAAFGYLWKENQRKEHQIKIIDITLVEPQNITQAYQNYIQDKPYLARATEQQLIYGPTYTYTYTNTMKNKPTTLYYRGMADLAGNLSGLITRANTKNNQQKKIFNIPFSQYAKIEHDLRIYHNLSENQTLATRLFAGIAIPYGNSIHTPFSRQFFSGGSNSIRAFRARTLGPGSYDPRINGEISYFDQAGDIKLELNAEYRTKIYSFLHGAIFADAGNIWLINQDEDRPNAKFSKNWIKEIAVGAGAGIRLDFNILLLRLDLAIPIRTPFYPQNQRWRINQIQLGNSTWRKDNLMLNIAIGYPF